MADIYADEGITGTKVAVRQGFQRMIRDCMDGQIDIILNEKYKGDLLMKKTFTVEPYKLTFVMKGNGNTAIPNTKKNFKESAS